MKIRPVTQQECIPRGPRPFKSEGHRLFRICAACCREVPQHEWIRMGVTADGQEICQDCFKKFDKMPY